MGKKLHELNKEELKELADDSSKRQTFSAESFKSFDKDGSGSIDKNELKEYIIATYPTIADTDEKREALFAELDTNGDGTLSESEFDVLVGKFITHLLA